jgi:hypothetical protein
MMMFVNEQFRPHCFGDERLRLIFERLIGSAEPIRSSDLFAELLTLELSDIHGIVAPSLVPPATLGDLLTALRNRREPRRSPASAIEATRGSFTPAALRALDEFARLRSGTGETLASFGPELLTYCVLEHFDPEERRELPLLDTRAAAVMLRGWLASRLSAFAVPATSGAPESQEPPGEEKPFSLPEELVITEDLTWRARSAASDAAYPFDEHSTYARTFDDIAKVLFRERENHLLLVGERGVGKTMLLAELARRAATGRLPFLAGRRFIVLHSRYFPEDESRQRLLAVFARVGFRSDLIVVFDDLASVLQSDRGNNKRTLLSELSRARCRVVGLLTPHEYEDWVAGDPEWHEFFSRVDVEEPDIETATGIVAHLASGLQEKFQLRIAPEAIRDAVVLSSDYLFHDQLPSKAVKILRRVCEDFDYARHQHGSRGDLVSSREIVRAVSEASGVPEETLRGVAAKTDYEQTLKEAIFGQDETVREVATELGLIKAGMSDPTKPASVMLFLGQTGTGKTELAKLLARIYSNSKRLKTYTLATASSPTACRRSSGFRPGTSASTRGAAWSTTFGRTPTASSSSTKPTRPTPMSSSRS